MCIKISKINFRFCNYFKELLFPVFTPMNESNSDDGLKKYERTFVWKGIHIFKFFEKAKKDSARMPKWYWN